MHAGRDKPKWDRLPYVCIGLECEGVTGLNTAHSHNTSMNSITQVNIGRIVVYYQYLIMQ